MVTNITPIPSFSTLYKTKATQTISGNTKENSVGTIIVIASVVTLALVATFSIIKYSKLESQLKKFEPKR